LGVCVQPDTVEIVSVQPDPVAKETGGESYGETGGQHVIYNSRPREILLLFAYFFSIACVASYFPYTRHFCPTKIVCKLLEQVITIIKIN